MRPRAHLHPLLSDRRESPGKVKGEESGGNGRAPDDSIQTGKPSSTVKIHNVIDKVPSSDEPALSSGADLPDGGRQCSIKRRTFDFIGRILETEWPGVLRGTRETQHGFSFPDDGLGEKTAREAEKDSGIGGPAWSTERHCT